MPMASQLSGKMLHLSIYGSPEDVGVVAGRLPEAADVVDEVADVGDAGHVDEGRLAPVPDVVDVDDVLGGLLAEAVAGDDG